MPKISRKVLKQADEKVRTAEKIFNYRSDVLDDDARDALRKAIDELGEIKDSREEIDEGALKAAMERLEAEMKLSGGTYYPKRSLNENFEVLLVAAVLAIGIRMFFVQPFRIPTNSMYPTFNGMTFEVFDTPADKPSFLMRPVRAVTLGASRVEVDAPAGGEIVVPVFPAHIKDGYSIPGKAVHARKWFGLLPTTDAEYMMYVGGQPVPVDVPVDFNLREVVWKRFGAPTDAKLELGAGGIWLYHTGVHVNAGDPVLCFDILMGDQLFVDRITYHFRRPRVGEPIVFRTDNIPGMSERERGKYYIKRLVGEGGDKLQVREPALYRNGEPITGAAAFEMNATRSGEYEGYLPEISTHDEVTLYDPYTVPEGFYFAMGDNSDESADSRVWGPLPETAMVGKALVIYYPFTKHIGGAH